MKTTGLSIFILLLSIVGGTELVAQTTMDNELIFSAIKGEKSKERSLSFTNTGKAILNPEIELEGENAQFFYLVSKIPNTINPDESVELAVIFRPSADFIGLAQGKLQIIDNGSSVGQFLLKGLSTKALEGKNEPPLADVVKALGYNIHLGWESLGNHMRPDLQGEEVSQSLFQKAEKGKVEMIPVARYSPPFPLPFGYYIVEDNNPVVSEVGALSDSESYPEHQTLFPALAEGNSNFDPKGKAFGFFTTSLEHTAYSEDRWNTKPSNKNTEHRCRIYRVKDSEGRVLPNQFLVCFEEASNGDYQDYVFLVKNIKPVNVTKTHKR